MTVKTKLSQAARKGNLYALQSILVKYRPWTSTRAACFTANNTGSNAPAKRYSLGNIPASFTGTRESQAAYIAALFAEQHLPDWPSREYVIASTGRDNEYLFVPTERKAFTLKYTPTI